MDQKETYKKSLETFNERCENDESFAALAKENLEKALNEVGITDVKAFVEFSQKAGEQMSDSDMGAVSGGMSAGASAFGGLGIGLGAIYGVILGAAAEAAIASGSEVAIANGAFASGTITSAD